MIKGFKKIIAGICSFAMVLSMLSMTVVAENTDLPENQDGAKVAVESVAIGQHYSNRTWMQNYTDGGAFSGMDNTDWGIYRLFAQFNIADIDMDDVKKVTLKFTTPDSTSGNNPTSVTADNYSSYLIDAYALTAWGEETLPTTSGELTDTQTAVFASFNGEKTQVFDNKALSGATLVTGSTSKYILSFEADVTADVKARVGADGYIAYALEPDSTSAGALGFWKKDVQLEITYYSDEYMVLRDVNAAEGVADVTNALTKIDETEIPGYAQAGNKTAIDTAVYNNGADYASYEDIITAINNAVAEDANRPENKDGAKVAVESVAIGQHYSNRTWMQNYTNGGAFSGMDNGDWGIYRLFTQFNLADIDMDDVKKVTLKFSTADSTSGNNQTSVTADTYSSFLIDGYALTAWGEESLPTASGELTATQTAVFDSINGTKTQVFDNKALSGAKLVTNSTSKYVVSFETDVTADAKQRVASNGYIAYALEADSTSTGGLYFWKQDVELEITYYSDEYIVLRDINAAESAADVTNAIAKIDATEIPGYAQISNTTAVDTAVYNDGVDYASYEDIITAINNAVAEDALRPENQYGEKVAVESVSIGQHYGNRTWMQNYNTFNSNFNLMTNDGHRLFAQFNLADIDMDDVKKVTLKFETADSTSGNNQTTVTADTYANYLIDGYALTAWGEESLPTSNSAVLTDTQTAVFNSINGTRTQVFDNKALSGARLVTNSDSKYILSFETDVTADVKQRVASNGYIAYALEPDSTSTGILAFFKQDIILEMTYYSDEYIVLRDVNAAESADAVKAAISKTNIEAISNYYELNYTETVDAAIYNNGTDYISYESLEAAIIDAVSEYLQDEENQKYEAEGLKANTVLSACAKYKSTGEVINSCDAMLVNISGYHRPVYQFTFEDGVEAEYILGAKLYLPVEHYNDTDLVINAYDKNEWDGTNDGYKLLDLTNNGVAAARMEIVEIDDVTYLVGDVSKNVFENFADGKVTYFIKNDSDESTIGNWTQPDEDGKVYPADGWKNHVYVEEAPFLEIEYLNEAMFMDKINAGVDETVALNLKAALDLDDSYTAANITVVINDTDYTNFSDITDAVILRGNDEVIITNLDNATSEITFKVTNTNDTSKNALVIVAEYSGDTLLNATTVYNAVIGQNDETDELSYTVGDGDSVVIYLWDSFENIKPYGEVYTVR